MERTPGLAVILVGDRRDSATYVKMKKKACAEVGINSFGVDYSTDVSQDELLAKSMYIIIVILMLVIIPYSSYHPQLMNSI